MNTEQLKSDAKAKLADWSQNLDNCHGLGWARFWNGPGVGGQAPHVYIKGPEPGQRPAGGSIEARLRLEWERDQAVQDEFGGDLDRYMAFRIAEDSGLVTMVPKRVQR